jgi:hypothetical protein
MLLIERTRMTFPCWGQYSEHKNVSRRPIRREMIQSANERVWIPYSKMYDIDIPYLKTVYGIWISIICFENAFDNKKQETFYTNFMEYEVQLSLVLENQSYEEFSITDCIISLRMGRLLTFLKLFFCFYEFSIRSWNISVGVVMVFFFIL